MAAFGDYINKKYSYYANRDKYILCIEIQNDSYKSSFLHFIQGINT